jgi:hypothetical protein
MKNSSASQISATVFSPHLLPDGSYVVRRSPQEIEVWGVNISDHYTIRVETTEDAKMDVIYLGNVLPSLKH